MILYFLVFIVSCQNFFLKFHFIQVTMFLLQTRVTVSVKSFWYIIVYILNIMLNIMVMYLLLEKQRQLWTVDLLVDSDWSAEGQTVTDNQNEHRQCSITVQLVCNEVALVNSHHGNKVSGLVAVKDVCWVTQQSHHQLYDVFVSSLCWKIYPKTMRRLNKLLQSATI